MARDLLLIFTVIIRSRPGHTRDTRSRCAFTLTEALFGVAIMGLVFVALYTGMAKGFDFIRSSQENTRATQILLEKFEVIRMYNWEQVNTPGFVPPTFTARFAPNEASPGIVYVGRVTIGNAAVPEVYGADLRSVTIDLNWTSKNMTRTRSFTTFVAKYGIQRYIF